MSESVYRADQSSQVLTIAVSNLLVPRRAMDPRLAEWMTRVVIKIRDDIGRHLYPAQLVDLVDLGTAIYHESPLCMGAPRSTTAQ